MKKLFFFFLRRKYCEYHEYLKDLQRRKNEKEQFRLWKLFCQFHESIKKAGV